ncbi:MAG TPA: tetratricopeptide repeat protein [Desulfosarcina sp.]|nr:tetratricopeptide repeat protein [Desulfosarcina sp.]
MTESNTIKNFIENGMREFANARYDKSIELFTLAIEKDSDHALALVSRGAAYLKLDNLDRARDDFDRAVKIDPNHARAYHLRGLTSERRGDDQTALADFDRAIAIDPEYGAAYYSRATLHAKLAHSEKAQDDIAMVAHLNNCNVASFMNDNNVWRTEHMRVEDALETELER